MSLEKFGFKPYSQIPRAFPFSAHELSLVLELAYEVQSLCVATNTQVSEKTEGRYLSNQKNSLHTSVANKNCVVCIWNRKWLSF